MPATEQTWRDSKLMHLVFGLSALAMLVTTIWMLAADHRREWKTYQQQFQGIEAWTAQARISQEESADYHQKLAAAEAELLKARQEVPSGDLIDDFNAALLAEAKERETTVNVDPVSNAFVAARDAAPEARPAKREALRDVLAGYVREAKFREDRLLSEKKFLAAELDVVRSEYELGVGNELPKSQLDTMQAKVDEMRAKVDEANDGVQNAGTHRKTLEEIVARMFEAEAAAQKNVDGLKTQLTQLETALYERERKAMNDVIGLPIIDAFAPKKVDQIWLPKLTINNNFRDVARFDRCTNCHQGIDKTAPGSAVEPGYPHEHLVVLQMATPAQRPEAGPEQSVDDRLNEIYGLRLAAHGLIEADEAVISVVRPESPAAKANLQVGDTIKMVGDAMILTKNNAYNYLLESVRWGRPLELTVRRGLPQPFASHPRLDLFVGSLSPHKLADVGCTICHDGQGSATAFKWASHSPDDPLQAKKWKQQYGWFDNHHWIYPMYPNRFSESLCLKCHHDVVELAPSERFPDPPAPKLMAGFNLIKDYGCFGCHEINGFDGPNRRIGPDMRAEPNYSAAASALLATKGLSDQQQEWAKRVVFDPDNTQARHSLQQSLRDGEKLPGDPNVTRRLVNVLDDVETPGRLRRVGPSLRHVASKVDFDFLYSWIRKPTDFRPSTKMPQFFGLFSALDHASLEVSERFEPMEIRGITEYLLTGSQPFEFTAPAKGVEKASAERGKLAFETRCLACHQHEDFPKADQNQGPNLSKLGAKLATPGNPNGPKWLYTWLKNPSLYHPRTLMPNMILDPVTGADGKQTDPAADIAAFLLSSKGWEAKDVPGRDLTKSEEQSLHDLALEHLKNVFPKRQAEEFLKTGIPERYRNELKGDEVELLGEMNREKTLRYVGRRSISKYGCSGCHDIPGFEDVKPIGTGLADWARKTPDKLAFEQINEYMKHGHGAPGKTVHEVGPPPADVTDQEIEEADRGQYSETRLHPLNIDDPSTGYFVEKLEHHQREGFIWQKLREPRSYDFEKTQNKSFNERLRMPYFSAFDDDDREAVITFVLGLVSEPPAPQYIFKADPRRAAIVQGNEVIEKFNCTGCHTLQMEKWKLAFEPDDFRGPDPVVDFPFVEPHFTPQQIADSKKIDSRGLLHATVSGMPVVDDQGQPLRVDEDGAPLDPEDQETPAFYLFSPWESVLLNGQVWQSGLQNLKIPAARIEKQYAPVGGFLARFAYPSVITEERKNNAQLQINEVWGWLPPPLVGEGRKVQTEWLHNFLLDPHLIRPAAVLRMPKFNMSSAEATKLVNYFAAVDGVDYPYDFDPRTRESHLTAAEESHPGRLNDALKIVTDNNLCVKCHLLGDFVPGGSERAKAPQLADVDSRLRPNFTLDWIANPKRILPYTAMPVNLPPDKQVAQELFKGTSVEQLNAVVDLLLNFDRFMESKTSIKPLIKPAPAAAAPAAAAEPANAPQPQAAAL